MSRLLYMWHTGGCRLLRASLRRHSCLVCVTWPLGGAVEDVQNIFLGTGQNELNLATGV
ncbi:hypothetical protein COCSUDRAFT_32293 [Coccomyxa subellipsoidea C-169]|uniref:Uncharacterized protein n=1 Tax=Coccomyxa subellipsoidea (strain C-169) TaxID=574566 RepID=I0Z896_COCSC|nr:hypothetical protein COCSUDRAFT_32293 [Coccomyxa subellipsoidea C-169]EIE26865.1 hypothetical protein COCSUDRAFT_32293 [Coccomyxa subellipsoidea C-169]|eukprot:XP_005651409.1 hypothetical protein COCSUDRAFT_32293 [Coccomyxa subellipsoidea C-169]